MSGRLTQPLPIVRDDCRRTNKAHAQELPFSENRDFPPDFADPAFVSARISFRPGCMPDAQRGRAPTEITDPRYEILTETSRGFKPPPCLLSNTLASANCSVNGVIAPPVFAVFRFSDRNSADRGRMVWFHSG